jgi:hypothetical protein
MNTTPPIPAPKSSSQGIAIGCASLVALWVVSFIWHVSVAMYNASKSSVSQSMSKTYINMEALLDADVKTLTAKLGNPTLEETDNGKRFLHFKKNGYEILIRMINGRATSMTITNPYEITSEEMLGKDLGFDITKGYQTKDALALKEYKIPKGKVTFIKWDLNTDKINIVQFFPNGMDIYDFQ